MIYLTPKRALGSRLALSLPSAPQPAIGTFYSDSITLTDPASVALSGGVRPFRYFVPGVSSGVSAPFGILFANHGSGPRGTDNLAQMVEGGNVAEKCGWPQPGGGGTVSIVSGAATFTNSIVNVVVVGTVVNIGGTDYTVTAIGSSTTATIPSAPNVSAVPYTVTTWNNSGIFGPSNWPVLTVFPQQYPTGHGNITFDEMVPMMEAMQAKIAQTWAINSLRKYHTALSGGGPVAYSYLGLYPSLFAGALLPSVQLLVGALRNVAAFTGATDADAGTYLGTVLAAQNVPLHEYHGSGDTNIPIGPVTAVNGYTAAAYSAAGKSSLYEYHIDFLGPSESHSQCWTDVYNTQSIWTWLFATHR